MKRARLPGLVLALLLVLTGCSVRLPFDLPRLSFDLPFTLPWLSSDDTVGDGNTLTVYRLRQSGAEGGELLGQEHCLLPENAPSELEAAIELFTGPSKTDGLVCPLPPDVTVEGWTLDNNLCTLTFSDGFLDLGDMDRTAAAFCAALTLCRLDTVDAVTVAAGGQVLFSGLVPEDTLLRDTDTDPSVRQLRLYFADAQGRYLVSEYHSLTLDEDAALGRYVMEELLRGPNSGERQSALPEGTELLSCATENGVCTVDLSREFYDNRPQTALGERLAVYSIVNSLTSLSQVDSVVILVEGRSVDTYVYRSLAQPLARSGEAIGPVSGTLGEADTDLYLPLPGLKTIAPLPWRIDLREYASPAEAVMAALLGAAEPGYPALFSGSGTVMDVTMRVGVCSVDLSESFFASLPVEARNAAIQSMAASLCVLEEIDSVFFTIGGSPALFDGVDWSGPWSEFDMIE